jgi:cell division transport system permease protein
MSNFETLKDVVGPNDAGDRAAARNVMPRPSAPIVPRESISGRALVAVVAIMSFLAALSTGAMTMVRASAGQWQSEVASEITIQVRPVDGRDIEADLRQAADIARATPGVAETRVYTKAESMGLLEPWLGSGLEIADLPVPRLIVVRTTGSGRLDTAQLGKAIAVQVPTASVDDHRAFVERMRLMSGTAVFGGLVILVLVFAATVLSVTFATRAAMAGNHSIIEVLHLTGARDAFIASHFQRHFLVLGLIGGAIGSGAALLIFIIAAIFNAIFSGSAAGEEAAALFGGAALGWSGYLAIVAQTGAIALVTTLASRHTVNQTLAMIE